jgi:hypothetical protein
MIYCVLCSPPNLARPPRSNVNQLHYMRPPAPPPEPPSFMARIVNFIYNPFGYDEDVHHHGDQQPAASQIDHQYISFNNIERIRDIEPTTPRTTVDNVTPLHCHPCNKIPWIPMIPTFQMPLVNSNSQSVGPYPASNSQDSGSGGYHYPAPPAPITTYHPSSVTPLKVVGYNYPAPQTNTPATVYGPPVQQPSSTYGVPNTPDTIYGSPIGAQANTPSPSYKPFSGLHSNVTPVSTYAINQPSFKPPSASYGQPVESFTHKSFQNPLAGSIKPIKLQAFPTQQNGGFNNPQSYYQQGKFKQPQSYYKGSFKPQSYYPFPAGGYYTGHDNANIPITTITPQTNTIDTSVILLTTPPPNDGRPQKFTAAQSVTNVEYLPPPNVLPLEHESANYVPIPIPNLSATPIVPLFDSVDFLKNPYLRPNVHPIVHFHPLVPDSQPQLSNTVNVQSLPGVDKPIDGQVEVVQSLPIAEFTTTVTELLDSNNRFVTSQPVFKITDLDWDLNNSLIESNTVVNTPNVVDEPVGQNLDSIGAESENSHKSNVYGGFQNNAGNEKLLDSVAKGSSSRGNEQSLPKITTESSNVIVQFLPSLQTTEDLAGKIKQKLKNDNQRVVPVASIKQVTIPPFKPMGKVTVPKEITTGFTSTIRPATRTTTTARITTTTETETSAFQPLKDFTKKITQLWSSSVLPVTQPTTPKIRLQTQSPITITTPVTSTEFVPDYTKQLSKLWTTRSTYKPPVPTTTEPSTSEEVTTLSFISTVLPKATTSDSEIAESSGVYAGITPPEQPVRQSSTKKPKQIQIIIPYTTYHDPRPFKIPDENDEPLTYPNLTRVVIPIRGHYITHPQNYRKGDEKNDIKSDSGEENRNEPIYIPKPKPGISGIKSESEEENRGEAIYISKPNSGISYNIQDILEQKYEIKNQVKNEIKNDDMYNGHGYQDFHNDQEYPDHAQESQIIEAKVTTKPTRKMTPYYKTTVTTKKPHGKPKYVAIDRKSTTSKPVKYITKIVASNIKELLKKERTPKPNKIDVLRLQKNIDGWTEQSFSGRASTIPMAMGHTKTIPREYLTSTMKPIIFATTLSTLTTFNAELMEETKKQYERILYKNEENLMVDPNSVKRNDISRFLDKNHEIILFNHNLTNEGVEIFTKSQSPNVQSRELWNKFPITESPLTRERVYVVTPQSFAPPDSKLLQPFKSPRFSIRPTVQKQKPKQKQSEYS